MIDCPLIPRYRGELAWFLASCPVGTLRDPPRAVVLATRQVEQMPEDSQTLIVLGVAQLRAGEYRHATTALQKAKDLARGDSAALGFYLAMAQCGAHERQLARRSYERARVLMQKTNLCDRELRSLQAQAAALLRVAEPW